jgi:hypothetical protein
MARLTITLPEDRHRALKETAARTGKTIGDLIVESIDFYGIKTRSDATALVAEARERSGLSEQEALELAVEETRLQRSS